MTGNPSWDTRGRLLSELQKAGGAVLSGEGLASLCGVSRTAIWKAARALKAEGYPVFSVPKGYGLDPASDLLTLEGVTAAYTAMSGPEASFTVFREIDSTNSHARRLLAEAGALRDPQGMLTGAGRRLHRSFFAADTQSAGRGRMGRSFSSPPGCGLYFTLVFCPSSPVTDPARHTTSAAVAVCRTLSSLYGIDCGIKWVNDIFFQGKKICGILTEGVSSLESGGIEALVTGIGINVREPPGGFPPELRPIAGAVTAEFPPAVPPRNRLAGELAFNLLRVFEGEDPASVLEEYKARSIILGKEVEVHSLGGNTPFYTAAALDIDGNARLVVRTQSGETLRLSSGEVRINPG
ncbi:MAG: biotin--[acetyl-CoA-carboxylase] ligase [Spirochaetaceae bacterium]|jgi:BirA family biotin operon repressor/biotin-[acetyl-CoA-carboxylase] ligase|nr:biotin--[acetyl-CoA-carboxylase] ligase [Spirochaetaceae bacterium]